MKKLLLALISIAPYIGISQTLNEENSPIIDVHLHAFDARSLQEFFGIDSSKYDEYKRSSIKEIERLNIYGFTGGPAKTVKEWKKESPDRIFSGYMAFDALHPEDTFDPKFVRELYSKGQLEVFSEVTAQYLGLSPSSPELDSLWAIAEELDIPVGYHMGHGGSGITSKLPKYRASLGNPLLFENVLVEHPRLRLYIMHAGWPMLHEMIYVLSTYPNVYVGIGNLDRLPDSPNYVKALVDAGYEDRIMFGSDQMVWPDIIKTSVKAIQDMDFLSKEQKRKIFYWNAVEFFNLKDNPPGQ